MLQAKIVLSVNTGQFWGL